ncbi:MAG: transcription repressor NadR [bacterium]
MGSQRREGILSLLAKSKKPVTGSYLARHFGVSRQVIVQDIALLRARGLDIVATAQGYIFGQAQKRSTATRRLACRHAPGETRSELLALVQAGCLVVDVIVEHPLYGEIRGLLLLETEADVEDFIERYNNQEALLLSTLTGGVHLHTIEADDPAVFQEVEGRLRELGFLLEEGE